MEEPFLFGRDAKTYYGPAGTTPSTELTNVRNASIDHGTKEADVTSRAAGKFDATAVARLSIQYDFEMLWLPDDPGFIAIRNAYLGPSLIALKLLDREGGQGPDGDWSITNFKQSHDLDEAQTVSVTAKLAVFRNWIGGGGGGNGGGNGGNGDADLH